MPLLQPKVFVSSRGKTALLLLVCLVFVGALALPSGDPYAFWRILGLGLFGLGAVAQAWLLVRPQRLIFDPEGFTLSGGLILPSRAKKIPWSDVDQFFIYHTSSGNKMIALNFKPEASERTRFAQFSRAKFGADGALPGLWPGGREKMVEELNRYRELAVDHESYPTAPRSCA